MGQIYQINQVKVPYGATGEQLKKAAAKQAGLDGSVFSSFRIVKESLDARKKPQIFRVCNVQVTLTSEKKAAAALKKGKLLKVQEKPYTLPAAGTETLKHRPVIIGSGPAGLFCGLLLAKAGYAPLLLERGASAPERKERLEQFWAGGILDVRANAQFGEGGAGTFSDGKLNTLVKDPFGRNREVLRIFAEAGAPEEILYMNKPHIGTDILIEVIQNLRKEICALGGEVRFFSQVTDLDITDGKLTGLTINNEEKTAADVVVLAIGHSARDTFEMLREKPLHMEAKAFAVGVRIEHPQAMIQASQYGANCPYELPAASYKLTHTAENGRGVYSFCMCPGGYVVNASSEEGRLAVNGMSYHDRDSANANSAMIVTVTPEDFPSQDPLGGVAFQRALEEKAFALGAGRIPQQLFGDFCAGKVSEAYGDFASCTKGATAFANLRELFPEAINAALEEGIKASGRKIKGFDRPDAILSGVESRTSSPVRISRDEMCQSPVQGIYPCGEGAGYAGGITSAAMDGMKVAEEIIKRYAPPRQC